MPGLLGQGGRPAAAEVVEAAVADDGAQPAAHALALAGAGTQVGGVAA
jgi:hypothetical protein